MELIFQYPVWFIIFCLLLGAIYAGFLYFKTNHFTDDSKQFSWILKGLSFLRFVSIGLIAFLLLSPLIKSKFIDKIEPVVIFLHDNSESTLLNLSSEDSTQYIQQTNEMLANLSEEYQIDYYTFDNELRESDTLNFNGKSSNLSLALEQINGLYFNQNVGAVIFASDGIFNQGINPKYTNFNFPLYTVALGDTNQQTDLKIINVRSNKLAYLDDKVQVDIFLQANHLVGEKYKLQLLKKGIVLQSKTLDIKKDFDEQQSSFVIEASAIGIHKYTVQLTPVKDEISLENNQFDFYLEVIDNRQKILLVANAPHPDIAAIKSVVEINKNFEIDIQYASKFNADLDEYSLVIAHQIPSLSLASTNVLKSISSSNLPTWYIAGNQSAYSLLNAQQTLVQIAPNGNNTNDAAALLNTGFNSFTISEESIQKFKKFPPLVTPFGDYNLGNNAQLLIKQKIGTVATDFPILAFQDLLGKRSAILVGEGLWRWKLHDYLENNSSNAFNELIEKTINYLALKGDKRKFRVNTNKSSFLEGEVVQFEAELYNDNYELVNEPEVSMTVTNEEGDEYNFSYAKTEKAYTFKTKSLPIGSYTYTAELSFNGKKYSASGAFSISAIHLEAVQTKANHQLLKELALKTNGQFVLANDISQLDETILNKDEIKATLYESFKTRSIINLFGIFFAIMLLLSIEWFARKWFGAY